MADSVADKLSKILVKIGVMEEKVDAQSRSFIEHVEQDKKDFSDLRLKLGNVGVELSRINTILSVLTTEMKVIKFVGGALFIQSLAIIFKLFFG